MATIDVASSRPRPARTHLLDKVARKVVQLGFLFLALYPFVPFLYKRLTAQPGPTLTSWLLPWDPLLFLGHLAHGTFDVVVIGAPLLLLALTFVLGRSFCGWVCPMGTLLDLVRPLAFWQKRKGYGRRSPGWLPMTGNSPLRYYLLAAVLLGGLVSVQVLGMLDPLVIVQRGITVLTTDLLVVQQPILRVYLTASGVFLALLVLELWQPRFWCRHLCPLGALLSITSRRSLLNRQVSSQCNSCGDCRRYCPMRAIPKDGHDTNYAACHMCLGCESVCPQGAISFGFGVLSNRKWQVEGRQRGVDGKLRLKGRYVTQPASLRQAAPSRREFVTGMAAGAVGLALPPTLLLGQPGQPGAVIRPPGALPEDQFVRACIICQECVRVCPTSGLKPAFLEAGPAGIGTPRLVSRVGACLLLTSCPNLCAQACPAGALRPIQPSQMKIGLAKVDRPMCLAWAQAAKCMVCIEACPTGAAQAFNGRVTVEPTLCVGCGKCEQVCPVADSAIHVLPVKA